MSPRFKRLLPIVEHVPNRTGIRFHVGTKPSHSSGCILVPSRELEDQLVERQRGREAERLKGETITNHQSSMKRFILTFAIIALITSCKTQQFTMPLVIRDSVSVTYRQGKEQPASPDAIGAQTDFRKNSGVPADGSVGLGATQGASVFEEVQSARTKKQAVPTIRVDTVYIERWHSQIGGEAEGRKGREVGDRARDRPKPFYRHCTIGFWILLLLTLGRIAFKLFRLFYLHR